MVPCTGHDVGKRSKLGGDLLDQQIQIAVGGLARLGLQLLEILRGIVEAVGMIDAQAIELAVAEQFQHQSMRGLEHRLVLHAKRGEIVDVEEAAVVDVIRRHSPVGEAIALALQ